MTIEVDGSVFAGPVPIARDAPQDSSILTDSITMAVITFAALQIAVKVTIVRITSLCNTFCFLLLLTGTVNMN